MTNDVARAIAQLQDRDAVRTVLFTYADRVDAGDIEALTKLFTPDAVYDFMGSERHGRGAIAARVRSGLARFDSTSHHVSSPLIIVDGDRAEQTASLYAYHHRENGELWQFWGRYRQDLVRGADGWRIARMELHGINCDPPPIGDEKARYRGHPDRQEVTA